MNLRDSKEVRHWKSGPVVRSLFSFQLSACAVRTFLWLIVLLAAVTEQGRCQEPDHSFRFAFSSNLMWNVDENDTRASMRVWTKALTENSEVKADPDVLISHDLVSIVEELQNRTVDGVAMRTDDFMLIRDRVRFNRHLFGYVDGSITEEYLLIVHADDGITKTEDLRGRSLNILRHSRMGVALPWLDTFLLQKGFKAARDFIGQITEVDKLVKAVLPVFFRKIDACLVTRKGFKAMVELNPQLSRKLRVLATSPEFVIGGMFLREGYPPVQQDKFVAEVARIHLAPSGHQILTVFQTERLEEHPAAVMAGTFELLATHKRLLNARYAGTASKTTVAAVEGAK